jgi:lipopolysaccharide export system protein LptC
MVDAVAACEYPIYFASRWEYCVPVVAAAAAAATAWLMRQQRANTPYNLQADGCKCKKMQQAEQVCQK